MPPIKIMIINPNTNQSMTQALQNPVNSLGYSNTEYTYLTPSGGVASINNEADAALSADASLPPARVFLETHDAFLVACYSPHPLISMLQQLTTKPVMGIFEASVHRAVQLLQPGQKFGIVSTGDIWQQILSNEIQNRRLGPVDATQVFVGVETCGLNAGELHGHKELERRIKFAAGRLVWKSDGKLGVVILGCAGMVGMEGWVREIVGDKVKVVDGVKAGVALLQGLLKAMREK